MIKIHKHPEYEHKQSVIKGFPMQCPFRLLITMPSGGGKTTVIVSLILDHFRGAFERIYIVSPTIHVDSAWQPVKRYIQNEMKVDTRKEKVYFDEFDPGALKGIISKMNGITKLAKEKGMKTLPQILIVLDDVADREDITRRNSSVHELFVRGRHVGLNTILSLQKVRVCAPLVRVNVSDMIIGRLRSMLELQSLVEEFSGVYGKEVFEAMYKEATSRDFGFLYIHLTAKNPRDMFWADFTHRLLPQDVQAEDQDDSSSSSDSATAQAASSQRTRSQKKPKPR